MTTHAREEVALATVGDEQPRNAVTSTHDRLAKTPGQGSFHAPLPRIGPW
mgnify:CR=1 FL=1